MDATALRPVNDESDIAADARGLPEAGRNHWAAAEGSPTPLGCTYIAAEAAYNFALYSRRATSVTLLLFENAESCEPSLRVPFDPVNNRSGTVWHARVPGSALDGVECYGYSVGGPFAPQNGDRFDADKVLLDPYARAVALPRAFERAAARRPGSNAGKAPLAELPRERPGFAWGEDRAPVHTHDTVIYEMHVRGFTRRANSGVAEDTRGTFAGVIEKIPYLVELGVTVVELLPVYQFQPEEGGNYWGYNPLAFFAPHDGYSSATAPAERADEFRRMVQALHAAGIEVVLDVVYNHTTELDETGPTYSLRGIDNQTYYLLEQGGRYRNDTGCGNVLHTASPAVRKLVVDSLRYWRREMHVDGFRFDLASIFTRNSDGSINLEDPPVISEIGGDPEFEGARLIAEAWDLGSYLLGSSYPGDTWLQWNGQFRDQVRAFLRGENGRVTQVITRMYGSDDLFPDRPPKVYHPFQSVNFVTCHDGFCLYDLVAYDRKHNRANGHQNQDGTDDNASWNCGWEGDRGVPDAVMTLRKQQAKNFAALLLLANGTPMFLAGDEFLNTQGGNNNPYNQDNETTWLDWDRLEQNRDVFRFFQKMIAFRKAHPTIGRSRYWRDDVRWHGVGAAPDTTHDSRTLAFFLAGAAEGDDDLYVMVNAYHEDLAFAVQARVAGDWRRAVDTALPSPDDIRAAGDEVAVPTLDYTVRARSVVVLLAAR